MTPGNGKTPVWVELFLKELRDSGGHVLLSAELSGVTARNAYFYRAQHPEFRARWRETFLDLVRTRKLRRKVGRPNLLNL